MNYHTIHKLGPTKLRGALRWYFLDIETWGLDPRPQAFAFACVSNLDGSKREVFYDPMIMRLWLEEEAKSGQIVVYAHNGHRYDYLSMMTAEEIATSKKVMVGTKVIEITINNVKYRDSITCLPMSIDKMGDAFQMPKGITPEAFKTGSRRAITELDIEYCWRDIDIMIKGLSSLMVSYHELWGAKINSVNEAVFDLPLTAASVAYRVWSQKAWPQHWQWTGRNDKTRYSCTCTEDANESLKAAYHGGRVQVIGEMGKTYSNVVSIDRNSMYPSVMVESVFPDMNKVRKVKPTKANLDQLRKRPGIVYWANVHLKATSDAELFIPVRQEDGRKPYVSKTVNDWLVQPVIDYALDHGWELVEINDLYFADAINPFKSFVEDFYDLRMQYKKNNDGRQILVKLVLNSLYGKFAQRDYCERIDDPETVAEMIEADDWHETYTLHHYGLIESHLCYFMEIDPSQESRNTWFGFAAFITGYALVSLQKVIAAAGSQALYCDTDSVHFTNDAWDRVAATVSIGPNLGDWDIEQDRPVSSAIYWEPKVYVHYDEHGSQLLVKHKGVPMSDGDLRKPQKVRQIMQWASALRRALAIGTPSNFEKRSARWCLGTESL